VQVKAVIVVDAVPSGPGRSIPILTALEQVANRSILYHALEGVDTAGVREVLVTGEADALIEARGCLESYGGPAREVQYTVRREGSSFASTLRAVAPFVGESGCLMLPADGLLDAPIKSLLDGIGERSSGLLVFDPAGGGPSGEHREGSSRLRTVASNGWDGPGIFAPGALRAATRVADQIGDFGAPIADGTGPPGGISVQVEGLEGWRRYRGDRRDLLELNRVALERLIPSVPPEMKQRNRLEGRLNLDPTASIRDSVIIGPTVIGPGAIVHDAYIGPWTSVGAGARVEGAEIERSIVSARASVTHVSGRLVASLVGQDARVFRDFSLPRAMRLWVGDGDEVALC
jgi:glucose-1-phosphate thymidylyltransferase